ncbi:putative NTF2-like domain superfamily protein [Septoria linicola]|nr:putative NTF2-like domain superfamily protein [Septoria linicola]
MAEASDAQGGAPPADSTETPRRSTKKARQETEKFLIEMCHFFTACANSGDHDNARFWKHMAKDFKLNMVDTQQCSNLYEYRDYLASVRAAYPKWHIEVLDCSVEVHEKLGRAKSWIMMRHTGWPEGCEREALNVFFWKRNESGVRICCHHQGFQGVAPLPLPFEVPSPMDEANDQRIKTAPKTLDHTIDGDSPDTQARSGEDAHRRPLERS